MDATHVISEEGAPVESLLNEQTRNHHMKPVGALSPSGPSIRPGSLLLFFILGVESSENARNGAWDVEQRIQRGKSCLGRSTRPSGDL